MGAPKQIATDVKRHYCPECKEEGQEATQLLQAVMVWPRKRMEFQCKAGHKMGRRETILR